MNSYKKSYNFGYLSTHDRLKGNGKSNGEDKDKNISTALEKLFYASTNFIVSCTKRSFLEFTYINQKSFYCFNGIANTADA